MSYGVLPHCGRRAGRPADTSAASAQRVGASFARPARVTDQLSVSRAVDAHPSANSICGHGALPRAAEAWRLSLVLPHCGRRAGRPAGTSAASAQHVGQAFARPASVTDQPRVDPHRGRSYCHPSARAPRVAVSYGGVGSRANGCTPRAWAQGRGTHSGCTRRARWASVYMPCRRDRSAMTRPPSVADHTAIRQRVHRELP